MNIGVVWYLNDLIDAMNSSQAYSSLRHSLNTCSTLCSLVMMRYLGHRRSTRILMMMCVVKMIGKALVRLVTVQVFFLLAEKLSVTMIYSPTEEFVQLAATLEQQFCRRVR